MLSGTRSVDPTSLKKPIDTARERRCARYRWHLFDKIEAQGRKQWLEGIRQELRGGAYRPQPLLRVWIPKSNGGQRPLGIPPIRDRVVQMAVVLVIGPIFEADMLANQYGFRPELDAKMAVRQLLWHVKQYGRREVVDADLRDYFAAIPHGSLMRCLIRRLADRRLLRVIKGWLTVPVVERVGRRGSVQQRPEGEERNATRLRNGPDAGQSLYFQSFLLA